MRCEEFVTKFLSILKVDKEEIPNYHLHVAQLVRVALPSCMIPRRLISIYSASSAEHS